MVRVSSRVRDSPKFTCMSWEMESLSDGMAGLSCSFPDLLSIFYLGGALSARSYSELEFQEEVIFRKSVVLVMKGNGDLGRGLGG